MYCEKCGKQLPEGEKYCDCSEGEIKKNDSGQSNESGSGLLVTIIGVLGALCSFPFLMIEMNRYSHRGGARALETIVEKSPWLMPVAFVSVIILIIGLQKMFGKK